MEPLNDGKYRWCKRIILLTLITRVIFWPLTHAPETRVQGYLDSSLMTLFVVGVILVVTAAVRRCWKTLHGAPLPDESFGAEDNSKEQIRLGCC